MNATSLQPLPSRVEHPSPEPRACRFPPKPAILAHDLRTMKAGLTQLLPDLRGRAMRLCSDRSQADDLVQDTVERALRFAAQYEHGTNLRAWAYQILFSVFVTRYRRQRRERKAMRWLATDPCAWTQPSRFPAPDACGRLTPATERAMSTLPAGFRSVLELVDLGHHSYREAASELGLPVGTVMSRLHRGRKLLASRLGEPVDEQVDAQPLEAA
jgi:RNA polymerase sigma-70 factor (ECF subfamily)